MTLELEAAGWDWHGAQTGAAIEATLRSEAAPGPGRQALTRIVRSRPLRIEAASSLRSAD